MGDAGVMEKLRTEITKGEEIRYISHLDYARVIERAIRRANLPVAYSEGFNPHMKISFASALAVGVTSEAEYLDIELNQAVAAAEVQERLSAQLPAGLRLKKAKYVDQKTPALMAVVNLAQYKVIAPAGSDFAMIEKAVAEFNQALEVRYIRESPKGKKEIDVKDYVEQDIAVEQKDGLVILSMTIKITPTGSVKPGEVLKALVENFALNVVEAGALIHRTGLFIANEKVLLSPIDL
ncbi:hypothetical protein SPFL3102_00260 [Sporomusaceae bacterium FL31]|nr:hypothetical protein SPFL3101_01752 [Sporomusaceae bacterium FL31]GCE32481.1 hypothetical protein SPFL3102_00260 [Sporomusaceae bacterium]